MSISLLVKNADEIMEEMTKHLNIDENGKNNFEDESLKEDSFEDESLKEDSFEDEFLKDNDFNEEDQELIDAMNELENEENLGEEACDGCIDKSSVIAVNFTIEKLTKIANALDENGFVVLANIVDETINKIAKKKTDEKSPKGAAHKAPKEWWDKMFEDAKKKNPGLPKKKLSKIVGDIWDNELSDKKREQIYKKHGKTKNPNK